VVVVVLFVFFTFFSFGVFFFFSVFVVVVVVSVDWDEVSCANTGIASENAIANVNSIIKSFFMLGLDLPMYFFLFSGEQARRHSSVIAPDGAK
jgi:hypothetical protein